MGSSVVFTSHAQQLARLIYASSTLAKAGAICSHAAAYCMARRLRQAVEHCRNMQILRSLLPLALQCSFMEQLWLVLDRMCSLLCTVSDAC